MPQIQVLTARGTRLTARRSEDSITWLYRGRALAVLPVEALLQRKAGLHLTKDADPAYWLDYEALEFTLAVLGTT